MWVQVRRRLWVVALLATGLALLTSLDTLVAVDPAFGLSLAAASIVCA
jgi:hypothetical protein